MKVYAIKILATNNYAVLLDDSENYLGLISLEIAKKIVTQKDKYNNFRWAGYKEEYNCKIFKGYEGPVFWFDYINPLNVPERYIIKKCKNQ